MTELSPLLNPNKLICLKNKHIVIINYDYSDNNEIYGKLKAISNVCDVYHIKAEDDFRKLYVALRKAYDIIITIIKTNICIYEIFPLDNLSDNTDCDSKTWIEMDEICYICGTA